MTTPTIICNLALDELPTGNITNLQENSLQGKLCAKHYPQVLEELLGAAEWKFAMVRAPLAEALGNDRETEWVYAYAIPPNMAWPVRVLDEITGLPQHYAFSGAYIYANVPGLAVDYVPTNAAATTAHAAFRRALVLMLASRLVMPILKDARKKQALAEEAQTAVERAMAQNHNAQPISYMDHTPDILRDRLGLQGDNHRLPPPDSSYPDPDYVSVFEENL